MILKMNPPFLKAGFRGGCEQIRSKIGDDLEGIGIRLREDVGVEENKPCTFFVKDVRRSSGVCFKYYKGLLGA